jgi:hypothetical protein
MSGKGNQEISNNNISISVPLDIINDWLYSKIFVEETDPIYGKDILQGKAIIAGKNITLLKFKPKLKLKEVKIQRPDHANERPKLRAKAWFHFSPLEDENNHDEHSYDYPIAKAKNDIDVAADVDISIDQTKGRIQINPKYAVLEAKISSGGDEQNEPEPFCQLTIPLQLEKLKVEIPLGVSKFTVPFPTPINKTFVNTGTEFPIQGSIDDNSIVFQYPIDLEEQQK